MARPGDGAALRHVVVHVVDPRPGIRREAIGRDAVLVPALAPLVVVRAAVVVLLVEHGALSCDRGERDCGGGAGPGDRRPREVGAAEEFRELRGGVHGRAAGVGVQPVLRGDE